MSREREIKIRYVWKRISDGHIWMEIAPIGCIEGNGDTPFILLDNSLWKLLSRDEFSGMQDKSKSDIYENDIVKYGRRNLLCVWNGHGFQFKGENQERGTIMGGNSKYSHINIVTPSCNLVGNNHENPELLS